MLKSIGWGEYMHLLAILIPVYYAIVLLLYFRADIIRLLSKGFGRRNGNIGADEPGDNP